MIDVDRQVDNEYAQGLTHLVAAILVAEIHGRWGLM